MQDAYVADVGDFSKLALLRSLCLPAISPVDLAVCWYRTDGHADPQTDGGRLGYLEQSDRFQSLEPVVFSALQRLVADIRAGRRRREIGQLEQMSLLPRSTVFHDRLCPRGSAHQAPRKSWAEDMLAAVRDASLVFLDPDNGLGGVRANHKSATLEELSLLRRPGRAIVVYHHQSRFKGGAVCEFAHLRRRLQLEAGFQSVAAVRIRPYSSRFYFLLDADSMLLNRFHAFCEAWKSEAEVYGLEAVSAGRRAIESLTGTSLIGCASGRGRWWHCRTGPTWSDATSIMRSRRRE